MDILSEIEKIEKKYDVHGIKYKDAEIWPYIRVYLSYSIFGKQKIQANKKVILVAIKNLFYGFFNIFKKADYIFFSNTEQRKFINGKYYDRFDFISDKIGKKKFFELTTKHFYKKNNIPAKNVSSKIPLYLLAKFIKLFVSVKKIENISICENIIQDKDYNFDIKPLLKDYISQYIVAKILLKIYKPKALILITSYTNYPYIHAFKENKIKVIEFQHGLITDKHLAYNYKNDFGDKLFPDYIFTFGNFEKSIFNSDNNFIDEKKVISVGHFYIDYLKNNFIADKNLSTKIKKYKLSIAVSLQAVYDNKMINFIEDIAEDNPQIIFVLIPRDNKEYNIKKTNVIINKDLNCYNVVMSCDIHCTIYSTCAVEALGLNKPNILINIDNKSKEQLNFLLNEKGNYLVDSKEGFSQIVYKIRIDNIDNISNKYFENNYTDNVNSKLTKILN